MAKTPAIHVKPSVYTPETVSVSSEGEIVVMKFGNTEVKMHYANALQFSQWVRLRAKEAKRRAGDTSRHWSAVGVLEDFKG
jgi:ribosomal protein L6P/L9E